MQHFLAAWLTPLARRRLRRLIRIGPVKIGILAALLVSIIVVWILTRNTVFALAYAVIAPLLAALTTLIGYQRSDITSKRPSIPIIAGMASIPQRARTLECAVNSIIEQVDHLHVYLNGYDTAPSCLHSPKITVHYSTEHGDLADIGKFFGLRYHRQGVYFTLDDDIIYPKDYVATMLDSLHQIKLRGVVGVHGVLYPTVPQSFLDRKAIHYAVANSHLRPVSLLGTGTLALPIDLINLDLGIFRSPRMADVWLARHLKERRIPMLAVPRPHGWLSDAPLPQDAPTIWSTTKANHTEASRVIVESRPWGLDDLLDRLDDTSVAYSLSKKWSEFSRFYRGTLARTTQVAVAELSPRTRIGDYLAFYCEPPLVLAAAHASLAAHGSDASFFRQAANAARLHDPHAAGTLLETALHEAARASRVEDIVKLSTQAAKCYRLGGDLHQAGLVLQLGMSHQPDAPAIVNEAISLAIDSRNYGRARELLLRHSPNLARDANYYLSLSVVQAYCDSIDAAMPWVAALFLDSAAVRQKNRLIGHFRGFRTKATHVYSNSAFKFLRDVYAQGYFDPSPMLHLQLALGDRSGASELLELRRADIARRRPSYLSYLEAGTASDFSGAVGALNRSFAAAGLAKLDLTGAQKGLSPLSRLQATAPRAEDDRHVSVIMTTFNCEDTVRYAIDSVLAQTISELELIIVDDGSTDGTREILADYAVRDFRIRLVFAPSNRGPYLCRNLGIREARGSMIAIQDADDYAHPQRLEHQLRILQNDQYVACYASHVRISDDGTLVPENHGELVGEGPMTLMMRRQVVDELGYFLPVRTRGDMEHRDRMASYYGSHRVAMDSTVLLLARDAVTSNSRTYDSTLIHLGMVPRLKTEARRRHQIAKGRLELLKVDGPEAGLDSDPAQALERSQHALADRSVAVGDREGESKSGRVGISAESRRQDSTRENGDLADIVTGIKVARRSGAWAAHSRHVAHLAQRLDLDDLILSLVAGRGDLPTQPVRAVRKPISLGLISLFLNRVDVLLADGSVIQLVEKGVAATSEEAAFWNNTRTSGLTLKGEGYEAVRPIDVVDVDPLSILYFPYLPELDLPRKAARRNLRTNVEPVVRALAKLNATNPMRSPRDLAASGQSLRPDVTPPTRGQLQQRLNVSANNARLIQATWEEVREGWETAKRAYDLLPLCLCHNDVGPGNVIYYDGVTRFLDFGLGGVAPIGHDLHTIIRWSGDTLIDEGLVENLFELYLDVVLSSGITMTLEDIRIAAWTAFYMRYADLRWKSARDADAFILSLDKMKQLIEQLKTKRG